MRAVRSLLTILAASLLVSGCQSPKATFERTFLPDPAKPYVGMTKEQIIACAGTPAGRYNTNTGETLVYHYSGAGPVPQAAPKKDESKQTSPFGKKKSDKDYDCNASLVFEGGHLSRVTFAPRLAVPDGDDRCRHDGQSSGHQAPRPRGQADVDKALHDDLPR